jgi:hypothetical protein
LVRKAEFSLICSLDQTSALLLLPLLHWIGFQSAVESATASEVLAGSGDILLPFLNLRVPLLLYGANLTLLGADNPETSTILVNVGVGSFHHFSMQGKRSRHFVRSSDFCFRFHRSNNPEASYF